MIEFITFAVEFSTFSINFVTLAIEFDVFAVELGALLCIRISHIRGKFGHDYLFVLLAQTEQSEFVIVCIHPHLCEAVSRGITEYLVFSEAYNSGAHLTTY